MGECQRDNFPPSGSAPEFSHSGEACQGGGMKRRHLLVRGGTCIWTLASATLVHRLLLPGDCNKLCQGSSVLSRHQFSQPNLWTPCSVSQDPTKSFPDPSTLILKDLKHQETRRVSTIRNENNKTGEVTVLCVKIFQTYIDQDSVKLK